MEDDCIHGLMMGTCSICLSRVKPMNGRTLKGIGVEFAARYSGRCAVCDEGIDVGDPIRPVDDGVVSGYAHTSCVSRWE